MPRKPANRMTRGPRRKGPRVSPEQRAHATAPKVRYFKPRRTLGKKGNATPLLAPTWDTQPNPPDGNDGEAYSYDLAPLLNTTNGVVITVTAGTLPSGLSIVGLTIAGTPDTVELQSGIQLTATNGAGSEESSAFDIDIAAAGSAPVWSNDPPNPPDGETGVLYVDHDFGADLADDTGVTFSVQSGTLPSGLSLNTSTGVLSGTPDTVENQSGIVIRATNAFGFTDCSSFDIDVAQGLGPELVTNGDFDGDASGWTLQTGWSYDSGEARTVGNNAGRLLQSGLSLDASTAYRVTFDVPESTGNNDGNGLRVELGNSTPANNLGTPTGSKSVDITTGVSGSILEFYFDNNLEFRGTIDNVSVKKLL